MDVTTVRPDSTPAVRELLLDLLSGTGAHAPFEAVIASFPDGAINDRPPNVPYTPWHVLEHIRRTQRDILDYIRDPAYHAPNWPIDYWPAPDAMAGPAEMAETIVGFRADQAALRDLVRDPQVDPFAVIPGTPGHTLAREIRLVADHNAYHIGEFAILRAVMGTWPPDHEA